MKASLRRGIAALEREAEKHPRIDFSGLSKCQRDVLRSILEERLAGTITVAGAEARVRAMHAADAEGTVESKHLTVDPNKE
jgi:hypothetical protein